jgi:hypothetical protein
MTTSRRRSSSTRLLIDDACLNTATRDFSNRPRFLTDVLDRFATDRPTLGLDLVWWVGQKEGAW